MRWVWRAESNSRRERHLSRLLERTDHVLRVSNGRFPERSVGIWPTTFSDSVQRARDSCLTQYSEQNCWQQIAPSSDLTLSKVWWGERCSGQVAAGIPSIRVPGRPRQIRCALALCWYVRRKDELLISWAVASEWTSSYSPRSRRGQRRCKSYLRLFLASESFI